MASTGDQIAKQYRLDKEISVQATHRLYSAYDSNHQELWVRVFPKAQITDLDGLQRACQKLKDLNRQDLETPIAYGVLDEGDFYFVTNKLEGVLFNEIVPKDEGLSIESIWPLVRQIGSALSVAHECGLYHLNLTPASILVVTDAEQNESIVIKGIGFAPYLKMQDSVDNKASADATAFAQIIDAALLGRKANQERVFSNVASVIDAFSEVHRAAILVHEQVDQSEVPPESIPESGLGRFLIASAVITLMAATATLYYWLTSGG